MFGNNSDDVNKEYQCYVLYHFCSNNGKRTVSNHLSGMMTLFIYPIQLLDRLERKANSLIRNKKRQNKDMVKRNILYKFYTYTTYAFRYMQSLKEEN